MQKAKLASVYTASFGGKMHILLSTLAYVICDGFIPDGIDMYNDRLDESTYNLLLC